MSDLPVIVSLFRTTGFRKTYFYQHNPIPRMHNCESQPKI